MNGSETPAASHGKNVSVWVFAFFLFALGVGGWSIYQHRTPPVLPADAPVETFSAMRAFEHTKIVAQQPHPAGSAASAAVAEYIADRIRAAGLSAEIQDAPIHWLPGQAATVHNVFTRIAGTGGSDKAVLLMAHYDSVPFGPGAADDGAGVAVLLETMRALLTGRKPEHDVIFLFSDGEEARRLGGAGCRGARAFVTKHPWFKDVAVVLNFDARGNRGPAYMYETPENNGWLIAQMQAADCRPLATSFMYEVFHSMPVDSDYTRFKEAGVPGFNIAFVNGLPVYHTALDTPENLDLGSVQHMGYYALNLTRHLANGPLDQTGGGNQVYFNTLGYRLVRYPASWVWPLSLGCLALLAAVLTAGLLLGHLHFRRVCICAGGFLACVLLCAGIGGLVAVAGYRIRGIYILYSDGPLTLGCILAAMFLSWNALRSMSARFGGNDLAAGVLVVWGAMLAGFSAYSPGASYLALWPLAGAVLGTMPLLVKSGTDVPPARWMLGLSAVGAIPGILLWPGALYGLYTCLMVIFAAIPCAGAALLLGLLAPLLGAFPKRIARPFSACLLAAAILTFLAGVFWPGFSGKQPQFTNLSYTLDADTGSGWWLSSDAAPNEWNESYLPEGTARAPVADFFPIGIGPIAGDDAPLTAPEYLRAPGPALALVPPRIEVRGDVTESGQRRLTLHVDSPRGAESLYLYASPETKVLAGSIEGMPLLPVEDRWFLSYSIFPKSGVTLDIETEAGAPVELRAVDHSYGFPDGLVKARPEWMGPKPNTPDFNKDPLKSDETIVGKTYRF